MRQRRPHQRPNAWTDKNGPTVCHLNLRMSATDYDAICSAARKRGKTMAAYIREAVRSRILADNKFYYIHLSDGTYHPPLNEPGFEDAHNARIAAAKHGGEVVTQVMETVAADE